VTTSLVTGGAGFIGSHLVRALLERGDQVRVLDDLSTGLRENLTDLDITLIEGDIRDLNAVREAVSGVSHIYHLAALISVHASMEDPLDCYAVNLNGSLNILWAAHQAGVSRVVLTSSAAVYGDIDKRVDENIKIRPLSPYASSKLAMEQAAQLFASTSSLPTVSLRCFNVYGPRQSPDSPYAAVIPIFIHEMLEGRPPTIHGDGEQTRDFVFVEDVVRAFILATEMEEAHGDAFNIGGGASISILDLAQTLQQLIPDGLDPIYAPPRLGDIRFSEADITRAESALGFRPTIDLKEGLQITVEWFQANKNRDSI
jgi:nucleoside-diphosphate-sugar epimerase